MGAARDLYDTVSNFFCYSSIKELINRNIYIALPAALQVIKSFIRLNFDMQLITFLRLRFD